LGIFARHATSEMRSVVSKLLQFLSQWLARDPARLSDSLAQFVGHPAYGLTQLRDDPQRFVFLLGGSDGEALFDPDTAQ
jgi:hypothetical protein